RRDDAAARREAVSGLRAGLRLATGVCPGLAADIAGAGDAGAEGDAGEEGPPRSQDRGSHGSEELMSIAVQNVSKRFGKFQALNNVGVEAPTGCLLALLGPSGSGKTTLLRIIAGLDTPDSGAVLYRDEEVTGRPARDRNVGFVFQHYALFKHMDVFENIAFG